MTSRSNHEDFIVCECGSPNHSAIIFYNEWDQDVCLSMHLAKFPLFKRIKIALKYIFNSSGKFGAFEEILIQHSDIPKFEKMIAWLTALKIKREEVKKQQIAEIMEFRDEIDVEIFDLKYKTLKNVYDSLRDKATKWLIQENLNLGSKPIKLFDEKDEEKLKKNMQDINDAIGKIEYNVIE